MNEVATIRQALPATLGETEVLPHNIEAEQQLLGAILTNNEVYDRISSLVKPEHFHDPVHQRIFERAAARIQKNALATPVTLKPLRSRLSAKFSPMTPRPMSPMCDACI